MFTIPNSIRGRLGSFPMFLLNIGCLLGYISGAKLDYYYIPCISVVFPIVFLVIFSIFPNTPQYYIRKEKTKVSGNLSNSPFIYIYFYHGDVKAQMVFDFFFEKRKKDAPFQIKFGTVLCLLLQICYLLSVTQKSRKNPSFKKRVFLKKSKSRKNIRFFTSHQKIPSIGAFHQKSLLFHAIIFRKHKMH